MTGAWMFGDGSKGVGRSTRISQSTRGRGGFTATGRRGSAAQAQAPSPDRLPRQHLSTSTSTPAAVPLSAAPSSSAAAAAAAAPPVQAILFDMDGVLTLSEDLSRLCGSRVMQKLYGFSDVSPEEFIPFVGTGEANFLSGVAKQRGVSEPDIQKLKDLFFLEYLSALKDESGGGGEQIAAPGARALVAACRAAGLRTAVASAADLVKVDASLDAVGFIPRGDFFDAVVTADAFERLKPAPDAFLAAAAAVGTDPKNCVVVEDAPAGVAAAWAAGMRVLGVCTTLSREQMLAEKPDAVRKDTSEVTVEELMGLVDSTVAGREGGAVVA